MNTPTDCKVPMLTALVADVLERFPGAIITLADARVDARAIAGGTVGGTLKLTVVATVPGEFHRITVEQRR